MENNITININVGEEEDQEPKLKVKKSKTKNGKKSVLQLPPQEPGNTQTSNPILDIMGI